MAADCEEIVSKPHGVPFSEAMKVWARVAALSFGGPAGQIAVMHRIIVEEKKWIGEQRFLQALNYCTLLPGPEAQQLATYIGWLMHRTAGGLVAGTLFVLPGLACIMALSWIYVLLGKISLVQGLFFGLKAAVLVIVVEAVLRVGKRALRNNVMRSLAAAAFVAIFFYGVPFPLIIATAGLIGFVGLVAPHIASRLAGPSHARILPIAALSGAILVVASDLLGRLVIAPAQLPAGIVTGLIGAPFFAYLLWGRRHVRG